MSNIYRKWATLFEEQRGVGKVHENKKVINQLEDGR